MKNIQFLILLLGMAFSNLHAQSTSEALPYKEIPAYPEDYTMGSILARTIDGLGYRYYWATEGLRPKDLKYRPSPEARSAQETLDHLYGLSLVILNVPAQKANIRPLKSVPEDFSEKRESTLRNLAEASRLFRESKAQDFENYKIIFKIGDQEPSYPLWNLLNGPLADALNHVGQIVSFRRTSGNPQNPKVNVFVGKTGNDEN